jgi:hypothetical protein
MKRFGCELLDDYLDGELAAAAIRAFERHLSDCAGCRREVAESEALSSLLEHAFAIERAAGPMPADHELIEVMPPTCASPRQSWAHRQRPARRRFRRFAACVAGLGAVMLLGSMALLFFASDSIGPTPRMRAVHEPREGSDGATRPPDAAPQNRAVDVQIAENQAQLAVHMPTRNKNVTIVWIFPTIQ